MKKLPISLLLIVGLLFALTACGPIGDKATSISLIYAVTAIFSILLLLGYVFLVRKKEVMFILLFSLVSVINIGYFSLSISKTLGEALLANRIAYFGSVFLPVSMLMIIANVCKIKCNKLFSSVLVCISAAVFLIAASPGFLNIYYKQVSIEFVNGVAVLTKVYGPLHFIYLIYLLFCFSLMIGIITYATVTKRVNSNKHALILVCSVLANIGVWLFEQLVDIDFEFLSISYIVTELFLLSLYLMLQEYEMLSLSKKEPSPSLESESSPEHIAPEALPEIDNSAERHTNTAFEKCEYILKNLPSLTPTERKIYDFYCLGKSTKEIMETLSIKESTLKYHNRNIYGKLGVSSRKQLVQYSAMLKSRHNEE